MQVSVTVVITQVTDGKEYKGEVVFGQTTFEYVLVFTIPIPNLDAHFNPLHTESLPKIFQITVTKEGDEIPLTKEEYEIFFHLLAVEAINFYDVAHLNVPSSLLESAALPRDLIITLPDEYVALLNAPKFDCQLATLQ